MYVIQYLKGEALHEWFQIIVDNLRTVTEVFKGGGKQ